MTYFNYADLGYRLIWILLFCSLHCSAATIDLRRDETLLPVFQAGISPRNVSGLETSRCEANDLEVTFLLKGEKRITMNAKPLTIGVFSDDRMSFVQVYTDYITIDDAELEATKIHKELGFTLDRLNRFLGTVRQSWRYDDGYSVSTKGEPKVTVFFLRGSSPERPLRLAMLIQWFRTEKERTLRSVPIVPPPGFEHVNMNPITRRRYESSPVGGGDAVVVAQQPKEVGMVDRLGRGFLSGLKKEDGGGLFALMVVALSGLFIFALVVIRRRLAQRKSKGNTTGR